MMRVPHLPVHVTWLRELVDEFAAHVWPVSRVISVDPSSTTSLWMRVRLDNYCSENLTLP